MADFTINIGAGVIDEYIANSSHAYTEDDCSTINRSYTIGLLKDTNTGVDWYYILDSYTNVQPWKTLKIKNISYSNPTGFYMEDLVTKIPEAGATPYDIDVLGVALDAFIPNFTFQIDNILVSQDESITFDLAVEDLNNDIGGYQRVTINLLHETCSTGGIQEDMTVTDIFDTSCIREVEVEVYVPPEGTRYVEASALDVWSSVFGGVLPETISVTTTYTLQINAETVGVKPFSNHSSITLTMKANAASSTIIAAATISKFHRGLVC
jgi:hypothetical protein